MLFVGWLVGLASDEWQLSHARVVEQHDLLVELQWARWWRARPRHCLSGRGQCTERPTLCIAPGRRVRRTDNALVDDAKRHELHRIGRVERRSLDVGQRVGGPAQRRHYLSAEL